MVAEDGEVFLLHGDLLASKHWNQNLVSGLDAHVYPLAISVEPAGAYSEHSGLIKLFDGCFGQEYAASSLGFGLDTLDEHAVKKGRERFDGLDCERLREKERRG
jgi:hypothetical protein